MNLSNVNSVRQGDRISIASLGTQRREAEATFQAKVNKLKSEKNKLLRVIWNVEDEINETKAQIEINKQTAGQDPNDVEAWDSIRTLEKKLADLERELRSVKRRNELTMMELDDKISLEEKKFQAEKAKIDQMEDQFLGDQDPDMMDVPIVEVQNCNGNHQSRSRSNSFGEFETIRETTTEVPSQKKPEDLSSKVLEMITLQMRLMNQQTQSSSTDRFFARQTAGRDLPPFSGECSEWPAFIAAYEQTTKACGFSPVENLYRLQKALRGRAKSSVQALLTTPDNVDAIITTLEEQFGQPRYVIQSLLLKVRESPPPKEGKPESLIKFANNVKNLVVTVASLKRNEYLVNPTLLDELVSKMDSHYRLRWGEFVVDHDLIVPTIEDYWRWLDRVSKSAQVIAAAPDIRQDEKRNHVMVAVEGKRESNNNKKCVFCGKSNHWVQECKKLEQRPVTERVKWVKETKRCFSCLRTNHGVKECRSSKECGINGCTSKHHPLLHSIRKTEEFEHGKSEDDELKLNTMLCTSCTFDDSNVLLRLLEVIIVGPCGEMKAWALCDEGATCSLLEKDVATKLGIKGKKEELVLKWTNDLKETHADSEIVNFKIKTTSGREIFHMNNIRTINDLQLPQQSVNVDALKSKFPYLKGVPVQCQQNAKPVLLLGEDKIQMTIARELKEPKFDVGPVASRTKLGWTIHGPLSKISRPARNFAFVTSTTNHDEDLHQLVKESFKLESFGASKSAPPKSDADKRADQLLESTSKMSEEKRWETGLLWKEDNVKFPPTKKMALARLEGVERHMEKDESLRQWYQEKIQYYVDSGYCRELTEDELKTEPDNAFYLPHFAASNPNKPNKRRLVFDAAAKSCGTSLNDKLMTGPDQLNSLAGVLMRFRRWEFAFGADVKEMFHQIKIQNEDVAAQRFLWRGGVRDNEPKVMAMTVMIFGAASSPCSAQYVMRRNAEAWKDNYPEAVTSIKECMYMDDLADSAMTIDDAKNRVAAIDKIQDAGGFPMLKWTSNYPEVLSAIPNERKAEKTSEVDINNETNVERVLGMYWRPENDEITFKFTFPKVNKDVLDGSRCPTKRDILRLAMSLFDPLGIISFYTIEARMLLQDIWRSELDWDQKLHGNLLDHWNIWRKLLKQVNNISVPRCYSKLISDADYIRLHLFCDASEKAYATVGYLEIVKAGNKTIEFVFGKARVSPLKPLSIPRLELLGAVLAVRIAIIIREEIGIHVNSCTYWTDSRNVLCWIRSDARKYKQFVGCRIGEILEGSEVAEWRWVPTDLNPADKGTRDNTTELSNDNMWITGPTFLQGNEESYPVEKFTGYLTPAELETKAEHIHLIQQQNCIISYGRFSSFNKLIRCFAWVRRYIGILKNKASKEIHTLPSYLLPAEWMDAEKQLLKTVQREVFMNEHRLLSAEKEIDRKSTIWRLSPFIGKDGLLRVGSRVANGPFNYDIKYPIILPGENEIVKLMLMLKHENYGHGNHDAVINSTRSVYWITNVKSVLKRVVRDCMHCRAVRAKPKPPRMGDLPQFRFGVSLPCFNYCGLDVFGPITITEGRKQRKRYVVLFTCLTTRAIHLEKIGSLDVDSMIMATRRFISVRNKPQCFYSDNGTNFTGAYKEIKASSQVLNMDKMEAGAAKIGISWKFIPPASPHFGGCWERLIRCVKEALYSSLKSLHMRKPREEVLETLLSEASNIVNNRPLTELPMEPGVEALTPNHFLIVNVAPLSGFGCYTDNDFSLRKQWRISQRLLDHFWTRWIQEYLPTLHERKKWTKEEENAKIGDFVYVADVNGIRGEWTKAIVVKAYPGKDGRVRVVDLRTPSGRILKRPIAKCAVVKLEPGSGN